MIRAVLRIVVLDQERGPLHTIIVSLVELLAPPPGKENFLETRLVDRGPPLGLDIGRHVLQVLGQQGPHQFLLITAHL